MKDLTTKPIQEIIQEVREACIKYDGHTCCTSCTEDKEYGYGDDIDGCCHKDPQYNLDMDSVTNAISKKLDISDNETLSKLAEGCNWRGYYAEDFDGQTEKVKRFIHSLMVS